MESNFIKNNSQAIEFDAQIEAIALEHFPTMTTLQTQKSGDDFKEVAVWSVKAALEAAYQAGIEAAKNFN